MAAKSTYVLGTGLSHDSSACLLRDGEIVVAIEKERITRIKHDHGNDTDTVRYCLATAGIELNDLALVVQNQNFGMFECGNAFYPAGQRRLFDETCNVPVVTISHHLAHAYSAVGTAPFDEMAVLVIDGCGNAYDEAIDKEGEVFPQTIPDDVAHIYHEKDSYYRFAAGRLIPLFKDFSPIGLRLKNNVIYPPTTKHSIGGVYSAMNRYCFGDHSDEGKLMGLAPYGRPNIYHERIFDLRDGRVFVDYSWMKSFRKPARDYNYFKENFQYYADIAYWTQREIEAAVLYVMTERRRTAPMDNLAFTGGVALNAVANAMLEKKSGFKRLYMTPAAGDNGLAIGCAFYGWQEVLGRPRVRHNGSSCFGRSYSSSVIDEKLQTFVMPKPEQAKLLAAEILEVISDCLVAAEGQIGKVMQFVTEDAGVYQIHFGTPRNCLKIGVQAAANISIFCDSAKLVRILNSAENGQLIARGEQLRCEGDKRLISSSFDAARAKRRLRELFQEKGHSGCTPIVSRPTDIIAATAELLSQGKIIGWFQSGSEFGPRALGRRSILADPGRNGVREFINSQIKFREDFRPFAPSVLREDVSQYFEYDGDSPYMILVAKVRTEWKERLKNVVHRDDTARIQTVTADWNPRYHALLKKCKEVSGIPILLNTSFNRRHMPIVETPHDALAFFYECALDVLVMEDFLVAKAPGPKPREEGVQFDILSARAQQPNHLLSSSAVG